MHLYGCVDDSRVDVGGCKGLVEVCGDRIAWFDSMLEMLWEGSAT